MDKLKKKNKTLKEGEPPYRTYATADCGKRDSKTNADIPTKEAVESLREWSVENKQ